MCCNHRESAREQKWLKTDAGEKDRLHNLIKYDFCLFQAHAQFLRQSFTFFIYVFSRRLQIELKT